jgi:hypothetical protein
VLTKRGGGALDGMRDPLRVGQTGWHSACMPVGGSGLPWACDKGRGIHVARTSQSKRQRECHNASCPVDGTGAAGASTVQL